MKLQDFDFRVWTGNKFTKQNDFKGYSNGLDEDVCEIELWTGYFDKKGNKIYENDILKNVSLKEIYYITRNDTYKMLEIIIYDKDCNENLYKKKNPAGIELLKMLVSNKNMSVIGNIHENADLLEE
ncbi:YopX family protein [Campylobacter upsaliensis]|uniref:YopX family protein n=1 Tax=Campylobacter upsaliensis TaxID=28080 RepID=UPI002149EE6B|nr:YopX family protein [Campylobacter upsaliensis]MCR2117062.1 YopX family protein [Campylobacter upsaliensis]